MTFPDYPFAGHFADIDGQRMHYLDEGPKTAAPVVMVHGNPSWSFYFRKLVSALSNHYRCIVPDHIGMGLSAKPSRREYPYTLSRRIDDLEALLEKLDINGDITLVLHDWGGMIGMGYGARYPGRIKRLVVMNTAAFHLPENKQLPWQLSVARLPLIGPLLIQGLNLFSRGAIKYCVTRQAMSSEVSQAYLFPYNSWSNRVSVLRFVEDIPLRNHDSAYQAVSAVENALDQFKNTPILICWGMRDFIFDNDFLKSWICHFPAAEVHRFADAGHYVLEDASGEIIALIERFLNKYP